MSMLDLLRRYSANALQAIAKLNDLPADVPDGALARSLAQALVDPERIANALERLDSLERLVLEHLLLQDGNAKTALVKQELVQCGFIADSPPGNYVGSPYRQMPRYFEDVAARLTALGLVFSAPDPKPENIAGAQPKIELGPGRRLIIPMAIRKHLPPLAKWMPPLDQSRLTRTNEGAAEAFQRDIFLFWSYVNSRDVNLTSRDLLPKRHWSRINDSLMVTEPTRGMRNETDTNRLYFIRLLMEELGLLERQAGQLGTAAGSREFMSLSLRARTERAFRAYIRTAMWNELSRIGNSIFTMGQRDSRMNAVIKRGRQFVTGLLRHTPPGTWIELDTFIDRAQAINYEFLLPRHKNYYGFHNPYHGHSNALSWEFPLGDDGSSWELLEARVIRNILIEPLHWLGIISLGWQENELLGFQITPIGAQILGIIPPEPEQPPLRRVIVQPNFQIFALDPISDYTLAILDEFAARIKSGHVFEYRLTKESVYEAQQRGITVSEIIGFLDQESSTPVPQNVKLTLQEWGRYHERIVFYQGISLCQVADAATMDHLTQDPHIGQMLRHQVSPTAALIDSSNGELTKLRQALQRKGYLPTMTDVAKQNPPPIQVNASGEISFRHKVADIHLIRQLGPFTERRNGGLMLTQASIDRAVKKRWSAVQVLQFLGKLQGKPLPPELVSRIKIWGHHYGDAQLQTVTLLQLKSASILRELADDPDIGPLIEPFSAVEALALVRHQDVAELREQLRARGIAIHDQLKLLD